MGVDVIIWNNLCGSEDTEIKIWVNGDFNICFEKLTFSVLPHLLLLMLSSYHFTRHQHLRRRGLVARYPVLHVRLSVCMLIILSALFLFTIQYAYDRKLPQLVYIIWGLVYTISWSVHSCYVWRLHRLDHLSLCGHWSLVLTSVAISLLNLVLLRTAILSRIYNSKVLGDFEEIYIYVTTALYAMYFLTFIKSQRKEYVSGLLTTSSFADRILIRDVPHLIHNCPEDKSWFLPKLFFCWINSLMEKGYKGKIKTVEDLFELPEDLQTSNVLQYFYLTQRKQDSPLTGIPSPNISNINCPLLSANSRLANNHASVGGRQSSEERGRDSDQRNSSRHKHSVGESGKRKSLLRQLATAFGWEYFLLGLLKLFSDACSFCNPIILNLLILYISSAKSNQLESSMEGYLYCLALFCTTFFGSLASTHFDYRTSRMSLKFRSVIVDCIYKKTLSTSQIDLKGHFSSGEIVNLMSTDADRVVGFSPSFHQFWSLPIQVCVVLYLLYLQVGLAFLSGMGFAVLLVPINRWIAIKIGRLSKVMMSQKDMRVKLLHETLQGIRTVKFHAWEEVFMRKVKVIRSSELSSLIKLKYLDALCVFFWAATPIAISTLTFTTYVLMGYPLTAAKVFTSISLFAILITPLNAFPWVVNGLMEAWVSLNRIQRLLDLNDLEPGKYYDLYLYYLGFLPTMSDEKMLAVKNASFSWRNNTARSEDVRSTLLSCEFESEREEEGDDDELIQASGSDDYGGCHGDVMRVNLTRLSLEIKQGALVGVVGSVGSGKSSLLSAILGEMKRVQSVYPSSLSLGFPLEDGFGYFSQESWIQRGSLKKNILFGRKFDSHEFAKVIEACALQSDIDMLPNGENTEVGESGVTLSGGQKARVALARTAYQNKKFYLLDDPYASVDTHVASHIHAHCIMGLLGHATRVVVTHHVRFLKDADLIVVMEKGRIVRSGPPSHLNLEVLELSANHGEKRDDDDDDDDDDELILKNNEGMKSHDHNKKGDDGDDDIINLSDDCNRNVEHNGGVTQRGDDDDDEGKHTGEVKWKIYKIYWRAIGSCLAICVLLSLFFMQASRNMCDWWLSYWVSHASNRSQPQNIDDHHRDLSSNRSLYDLSFDWLVDESTRIGLMNDVYRRSSVMTHQQRSLRIDNDSTFYLIVYASLASFNALVAIVRAVLFAYGGIQAAKIMHARLLESIFKASVKFFDTTSMGRIINRFSSDIFSIDDSLPFILNIFLAQSFGLLGAVVVCCYGLPFSIALIFVLSVVYYFIQRYYRHISRELKRISCITLSPIYAHFSETLAGLPIIRAHRVTSRFEREALTYLDLNQRSQFASCAIVQWLNIRFQIIGIVLVTSVSLISILQRQFGTVSPGLVGLAISYVLSITSLLGGVVFFFTETEKMMIAVERVDDYVNNVPFEDAFSDLLEGGAHDHVNIPPFWPFMGIISFNNVSLRYGNDLPDVLRGVTFETHQGERVGVVGRTGSGKSSLFLALMRLVPIRRGKICVDGVDIHSLPLREFRSRISMIPQDPFLFGGTVRENLDPCTTHQDAEIRRSLSKCNMLEVVDSMGGLNARVEEKGLQFSAGERQLLCLARTMLTRSHVLCIDEAMANVDMATDGMLQATIRKHFGGRTVITVSHRIESVLDYDRIMVMDRGKLVEFGTPSELSSKSDSVFVKLLKAR